jgi:hypothetical protein
LLPQRRVGDDRRRSLDVPRWGRQALAVVVGAAHRGGRRRSPWWSVWAAIEWRPARRGRGWPDGRSRRRLDRGARRRTAEEGAPPVRPPAELGFAPPLLPGSVVRVCVWFASGPVRVCVCVDSHCRATERELGRWAAAAGPCLAACADTFG